MGVIQNIAEFLIISNIFIPVPNVVNIRFSAFLLYIVVSVRVSTTIILTQRILKDTEMILRVSINSVPLHAKTHDGQRITFTG
jgi:hypothetical protein